MTRLIQNDDLKRLFAGSAIAVAAGLMVGFSVKPSLADGIVAPQQDWGVSAPRSYAMKAEAGVGAYSGKIPDYVVGTRWTQPQAAPTGETQVLAYEERAERASYGAPSADDYAATAEDTHVTTHWQDQAREPPHYPSAQGNTYYESDLPQPPSDEPRDYEPA